VVGLLNSLTPTPMIWTNPPKHLAIVSRVASPMVAEDIITSYRFSARVFVETKDTHHNGSWELKPLAPDHQYRFETSRIQLLLNGGGYYEPMTAAR
jgi:hypothetical protein